MGEEMNDADRKVISFVTKEHKRTYEDRGLPRHKENEWFTTAGHLARCEDTTTIVGAPGRGYCAEGTCDLTVIEYEMECPHGYSEEYRWDDSVELPELLALIEAEQ